MSNLDSELSKIIAYEQKMDLRRRLVQPLFFVLMVLVLVLHGPWENFWASKAAKDCLDYNATTNPISVNQFRNGKSLNFSFNEDYTEFSYNSPDATNMVMYIDGLRYFAGVGGEWKGKFPLQSVSFCRRAEPNSGWGANDPEELKITNFRNPEEFIPPFFQVILLAFGLLNLTLVITGTFKDFWQFTLSKFGLLKRY